MPKTLALSFTVFEIQQL